MKNYALLRLLLAIFFLYIAWPLIPAASTQLEYIFWGCWLTFLFLFIGANLSTLLQISRPPVMEQKEFSKRRLGNR